MGDYNLYWGDSHANIHLPLPEWTEAAGDLRARCLGELEASLDHARRVIDFWPMAYYPYHYEDVNGFKVETWRPEAHLQAAWAAVCDFAARHNAPGELVIFPGYEWQGNGRHGDHNVYFREDHPPLLQPDTLDALYEEIRTRNLPAYAIPHHTAYMPGVRSKDWSVHDEAISPLAEIFSVHGCSESDEEWIGLRRNLHMGPGVSGSTIEDALARGIRVGIIASNDSHHNLPAVHGWGLMGCYARELTRKALWEAFAERRAYGVTGDRIELDFTAEGAMMGAVIEKRGAVRALVRVRGRDALDRIELLRNNRVIATHCHNGRWEPPAGPQRLRCRLRIEAGWGPKPEDIPDLPPRDWQCSIEVPDGIVRDAVPCWGLPGQWIGQTGGSRCDFGFRTWQSSTLCTQATNFELEGRPADTVTIRLEGKTVTMTLAEAMAGSRIVHYMDEAAERVRRTFGADPDSMKRNDRIYFCGHKVKVHRAIPQAGLSAELDHTDADPPGGENFYRVRVTQRNGQAAWSSPIWALPGRL